MTSSEKRVTHTEDEKDGTQFSVASQGPPASVFTEKEQRRIVRRIDWRVVVVLGAVYAASLIDRSQIGVALISGMGVDLELSGSRYNLMNAVFFVSFILFHLPSTIMLRMVGPKRFLAVTTMVWGCTTLACGFAKTWTDMIALRVVLGACEAGFLPACAYLLSLWYPRYDLQKRNAAFFVLGLVPVSFSGIMAYGITQMEGVGSGAAWLSQSTIDMKTGVVQHSHGIAGWRWIFILDGAVTCAMAIMAWFLIVDFPEKIMLGQGYSYVPFLTQEEATWAVERIEQDRKDVMPTKFKLSEYLKHAWDFKVWAFALIYCFTSVVAYGVGFALPFILMDGMGFGLAEAQCLSAPPYLASAVATWFVAVYADKWRLRSPFILVNTLIVIIGLCILCWVENVGARYFSIFLTALPGTANTPCLLTWQANNIRGQWKRALVSTLSMGFGAVGGIIGAMVFRPGDAPHYIPGISVCLGCMVATVVLVLILDLQFMRANKQAASGGKLIEGLEGFRYTL